MWYLPAERNYRLREGYGVSFDDWPHEAGCPCVVTAAVTACGRLAGRAVAISPLPITKIVFDGQIVVWQAFIGPNGRHIELP